jgi:uncharacterized membrane protein required for colicin V production
VVYIAVKILQRSSRASSKVFIWKLGQALGLFLGLAEGLVLVGFVVFLLATSASWTSRPWGKRRRPGHHSLVVTGAEAIKSQLK